MKRTKKEFVTYFFISFFCLILIIFFLLNLRSRWENNSLNMQFIMERVASNLLNSYRENRIKEELDLYKEIKSFGIYEKNGKSIFIYGNAPLILKDNELKSDYSCFLNKTKKDNIILIRPLGMSNEFRMHPRMHMMMPRTSNKYLYLEVQFRDYFIRRHIFFLSMIFFPLLIIIIFIIFIKLLIKLEIYKNKMEKQEELAKLGEISRTLTHEIKNPLSSIKIQTALIRKTFPKKVEKEISIIENEVNRLVVLTEKINEFLKDPLGKPEKIDIITCLNEIIKTFDFKINLNNINLLDTDFINFDKQRLRIVLENIIKNAIESYENYETDKENKVIIKTEKNKKNIIVSIIDNGKGIKKELLNNIFDPYYTTKIKGSGIGLAISKRFVEKAGGIIEINSNENIGTEVRIIL